MGLNQYLPYDSFKHYFSLESVLSGKKRKY